MFETWNRLAFEAINAPAAPNLYLLFVARFLASWLIYLAAAGLVFGWIRGGIALRQRLFFAGITAIVALGVNFTIAGLWYHPRPFEVGIGHQFVAHLPEASFPSDHATVLFALALALLLGGARRALWALALSAALGVAWSRVYLGVHWPLDMVGSFGVAAIVAALLRLMLWAPIKRGASFVSRVYDGALNALGLPDRFFPRQG